MSNESKCPFAAQHGARTTAKMQSNADWWPNQLNIGILHQHPCKSNPLGKDFTNGQTGLKFTPPADGRLRRVYTTTFMLRNSA